MDSELQKSLDRLQWSRDNSNEDLKASEMWQGWGPEPYDNLTVIMEAARKVANLDYIAARDRIVPLIAAMLDEGSVECAVVAREAVLAALGITDPTICVHCGGTGAGEVQTPWKTNPCHHCGGSGEAPDAGQ